MSNYNDRKNARRVEMQGGGTATSSSLRTGSAVSNVTDPSVRSRIGGEGPVLV
jgi:hypothetical protein